MQTTHQISGPLSPIGVSDISELIAFGQAEGVCPYFSARHAVANAQLVVCSYLYLVDPVVAPVLRSAGVDAARTLVLVDEAHNIDDSCMDALSMTLSFRTLQSALVGLARLGVLAGKAATASHESLRADYRRLSRGVFRNSSFPDPDSGASFVATVAADTDTIFPTPVLPDDVVEAVVPGEIRDAAAFLRLLRRLIEGLKGTLRVSTPTQLAPAGYLASIQQAVDIDADALKFLPTRLNMLVASLAISDSLGALSSLEAVVSFAALLATYQDDPFRVLIEPVRHPDAPPGPMQAARGLGHTEGAVEAAENAQRAGVGFGLRRGRGRVAGGGQTGQKFTIGNTNTAGMTHGAAGAPFAMSNAPEFFAVRSPIVRFVCVDPRVAFATVLDDFKSVLLTSGTLSPLGNYARILGFPGAVKAEEQLSVNSNLNSENPNSSEPTGTVGDGYSAGSRRHSPPSTLRWVTTALAGAAAAPPLPFPGSLGGHLDPASSVLTGPTGPTGPLPFRGLTLASIRLSVDRQNLLPLVVVRGADQSEITSRFDLRTEPAIVKNYAALVLSLCKTVPDGVVVFFPSYRYLDEVLVMWQGMDLLPRLAEEKLVFVESRDAQDASSALSDFRTACDVGRGGLFLGVARGKAAEGIDFDGHYGRAVLIVGVPFSYAFDPAMQVRADFLEEAYAISPEEYRAFDAMRAAGQCMGRVLRSKTDFGAVILADKRFARPDKRALLPAWVRDQLADRQVGISADVATQAIAKWMCETAIAMAKPDALAGSSISMFSMTDAQDSLCG
jgi:Rad3-related DNA helicase